MNKQETKEKIKVMQAFVDGNVIQETRNYTVDEWHDITEEPIWNWDHVSYRIKPVAKIRPYTFEEMKEAVKKHGLLVATKQQACWTICSFDKDTVSFYLETDETYEEFMRNNVWLDDNSPCGIVEDSYESK